MLLKKDQFVFNPKKPEWGIGKVVEIINQDRARVFFQYGGYRVMVRKTNPLTLANTDKLDTTIFDNLNEDSEAGDIERHYKDIPSSISFFLEEFPGGFSGEKYHEWERDYKDEGHILATELLGRVDLEALLSAKDYPEITSRALKVANKTNLIFPNEKMALKDGLKDVSAQEKFSHSLYALLYGKDELEHRFEGWIRMLESIGAGKWTIASYYLFLVRPDKYMFVKPTVTQAVADLSAFNISYTSRLNWNTYSKVLKLSEYLKQELRELGPKDMIDVQSFMWCILRSEEEES